MFTSARQISLPTCYAEPKPYADTDIAQQDDNDRNLLLSYVSIKLGSYDDDEIAGNAMRPSSGWQKARFNDECEDLFDGEVPSTPTTRPAHRTFTGEGASTTTGSCFLMEGQVPSIVDNQNDVLFGNVQCFGPVSLGYSPSGVYHSRESAA